jgi:hypothetical protein
LQRHAKEFTLYALCMDALAYEVITGLQLPYVVAISVDELINEETDAARKRTTYGQFCWVCQPLICEFILDKFGVDMITYLEADSMFFADPEILFRELGNDSVSIVPHAYSPTVDQTEVSGKFCVQFNTFRNNESARKVLDYWKLRCFEYSKEKPAYYPGQVCLDYFTILFKSVKVIENPGAGVAVWNIQHRAVSIVDGKPMIDNDPIVFYHYHQYRMYTNGLQDLSLYPITRAAIRSVYKIYVQEILAVKEMVHRKFPEFKNQVNLRELITLKHVLSSFSIATAKDYLRLYKRRLKKIYNFYNDDFFR